MVAGTQFALRPTDNVQARVRYQDILVEDKCNIDCSKAFIGGEDCFKENHRGVIIFLPQELPDEQTIHRVPLVSPDNMTNAPAQSQNCPEPSQLDSFLLILLFGSHLLTYLSLFLSRLLAWYTLFPSDILEANAMDSQRCMTSRGYSLFFFFRLSTLFPSPCLFFPCHSSTLIPVCSPIIRLL